MDPLDLRLQGVIGNLEATVVRVIDDPAASAADRGLALNLRATLDHMRAAVVRIGEPATDATAVPDVGDRVDALERRTEDLLDRWDLGGDVAKIGDAMDDTIRVMSVVGKWPPGV